MAEDNEKQKSRHHIPNAGGDLAMAFRRQYANSTGAPSLPTLFAS
jgi:hypothetical protein